MIIHSVLFGIGIDLDVSPRNKLQAAVFISASLYSAHWKRCICDCVLQSPVQLLNRLSVHNNPHTTHTQHMQSIMKRRDRDVEYILQII